MTYTVRLDVYVLAVCAPFESKLELFDSACEPLEELEDNVLNFIIACE